MSEIEFPEPLKCLFEPKRFVVLWGGRGAGRSWGVARALLLIGRTRPIRVLCARELQKSISDSVHKLLSDQIEAMGLGAFYEIQKAGIYGQNGTSFSFEGIKNNINKIKSYEGIDFCWVEEAVNVSERSWGVLIPTIRKPGSTIIITFNPELETDYTYRRFVLNPDPEVTSVVKMNWRDNPWFPETLKIDLENDKKRDYDLYLNVWEGHCLQQLKGAIYAKEMRMATEDGRITRVPYDPSVPVDTFWDLGRADKTAIWFAQRVAMQVRVLGYYEESGEDITHFIRELQSRKYVYGRHWLPHDAKAKRLGSQKTIQEILAASWPSQVSIVPKLSVEDGINAARIFFPTVWFDESECAEGLNALRHYRYSMIDGQRSDKPLHDWSSDGADAFRYMAIAMKQAAPKAQLFAEGRTADRLGRAIKGGFAGMRGGWLGV